MADRGRMVSVAPSRITAGTEQSRRLGLANAEALIIPASLTLGT